jgi:hypothetical protein
MERIKIDREAALEQLSTLGYQDGETVYLRGFYPKNDPRIDSKLGNQKDKGRKTEGKFPNLPWKELEEWQNDGRGVYFVVHGGGHKASDIKHCRTIFYEHDDLPKDISLNLWQQLKLVKPTIQYDTGGRSIHSYWVLTEPISPYLWSHKNQEKDIWEGIQPDLLEFANADRGLKDLPRVMRLAGFYHMSVDKETKSLSINGMTTRVGGCDQRHSYDELRSLIPIAEQKSSKSPTPNRANYQNSEFIDLRECGHVLKDFNPNGRPNTITCRCPVHGEDGEHSNDSLHIEKSTGAFKCHAGCSSQVIYIEVKKRLGQWKCSSFTSQISSTERIEEKTNYQNKAKPNNENIVEDPCEDLADEVQELVGISRAKAPIHGLLSHQIAEPIYHRAKQFNIPPEALLGVLLPVAASQIPIGICIEIDASTQFQPPPIIWTGLVGEPGATKSPIFTTILRPLEKLQAEADKRYRFEVEQYQQAKEKWENQSEKDLADKPVEPVQREYYLQDATMEAIADCLSNQPERGVVVAVDELAGLFNGFDQYRSGGKGSDRQKWLSSYDGRSIKVNRKTGKRISLSSSLISIMGTIQPVVLRKQMGDATADDGFWVRFLWVPLPITRMPPPGDGPTFDLTGRLVDLYKELEALAVEVFKPDAEGRQVWREWHIWCEDQKVNEPHSALRAIYPKAKERAARVALIAHCINAVIEGRKPDKVVSADLIRAAIAFTRWCIDQARLIYADAGVTICEDSAKVTRFIERFQSYDEDEGWITARKVTHWSSGRNKMKANEARAFMQQIVDLGYAIDNGEAGKNYRIKIKPPSGNIGNKLPQSLNNAESQLDNNNGNTAVTNHNSGNKTEYGSSSNPENVTSDVQAPEPSYSEGQRGLSEDLLSTVTFDSNRGKPLRGKAPEVNSYLVTHDPHFKVGDRVHYTGQKYAESLNTLELTVSKVDGVMVTCCKPNGYMTTWIHEEDLEICPQGEDG